MPDITMCAATSCPDSGRCYRHADSGTTPCEWRQSYWLREDGDPVGEKDCPLFWQRSPEVAAAHDGSMS